MNKIELGRWGEEIGKEILEEKGFKILEHVSKNNPLSSIDVIAEKGNKKYAINVKSTKCKATAITFSNILSLIHHKRAFGYIPSFLFIKKIKREYSAMLITFDLDFALNDNLFYPELPHLVLDKDWKEAK